LKGAWVLVLLFFARVAHAEDDPARRAFDEGVVLEKRGDYAAALLKFKESADAKPTLGNRFHLAFCLEMTGKLATAYREYEEVDRLAREQKKADVVLATRQRTDGLRGRVPDLTLRPVPRLPPDGEVLVDGRVVVAEGLEAKALMLDPGEHVVTAHAPDHTGFRRALVLAEAEHATLDVPFETSALTPPPPPPESGRRRAPGVLPFATTAGTVALAAAGVVAFIVADGAASDARETCPSRVSCDDERTKVRTYDALALGAFASAAALAVVSVLLWRGTF